MKPFTTLRHRRTATALAWLALAAPRGSGAEAPPSAPAPAPSAAGVGPADPLVALNLASRAAYRRAKEAVMLRGGPVVLVEGDVLVLRHEGRRTEARFTPDAFHALKAVAHIPLALDVMLAGAPNGGPLDAAVLDDLRAYRALIVAARDRVAALDLGPEAARRQAEIVAGSLAFLDAVTRDRACPPGGRAGYARRMTPMVMANADDAARAELDALHALVTSWRAAMTEADRARLTVVVMGRPLPRRGNLAVQYFARLLGCPGEGERLVYAESLFDEPKALDLLATRRVDTGVGLDFFDDPTRMHRDLLGDAARDYLPALFGDPAPKPAR